MLAGGVRGDGEGGAKEESKRTKLWGLKNPAFRAAP